MSHRRDTPGTIRDGRPRQRAYAHRRAKPNTPLVDRIRMHVAVDPITGCWNWQLALVPRTGYGCLSYQGKVLRTHRVAYELFVGPIPDGMQIDHLCRNRACCNPDHLEPVTAKVNSNRSPLTHGGETHCQHGHPYDETNTYWTAKNQRHCRTCRAAYKPLWDRLTPEERAERKAAGLPIVDLAAYFAAERRAAA